MKNQTTQLASYPYRPCSEKPVEIVIEFCEYGWKVIKDTRDPQDPWSKISGYLHYYDDMSAAEITDGVRDAIIHYYYNHPGNMPGIGATPQRRYFVGLDISDLEHIGNDSKRGFYA